MKHLLLTTIAAVLVVGCRPSVPDISIHQAAEEVNFEFVRQNLDAGIDVNETDVFGRTALYAATLKTTR